MIGLILEGRYHARDRLPSELELAKRYEVGRGAVREALKALSVIGLVRVERGKGTFVGDRSEFFVHPISMGFNTRSDVTHLIQARKLIEGQLASFAAERADLAATEKIRFCFGIMQENAAKKNIAEFVQADAQFHFAIAEAAQNPILSQFLTLIRNLMQKWIASAVMADGVVEMALQDHEKILEAIVKRDAEASRQAMYRHLSRAGEKLLQKSSERER